MEGEIFNIIFIVHFYVLVTYIFYNPVGTVAGHRGNCEEINRSVGNVFGIHKE